MPAPECIAHIATPLHASGAIAIVHLTAQTKAALEIALALITPKPVHTGEVVLRDIAGIDRGVIARPSATGAMLMPHGGALLVRTLADKLKSLGITLRNPDETDPLYLFPEAQDIYEACALHAISHAPSRLAPRIILHQSDLWRRAHTGDAIPPTTDSQTAQLNRLIYPPTVAAIGPSNIGKSTLMNALARRAVATVADEPATTRDAVGVSLDLDGLTVTWIDTAGRGVAETRIDQQAEAAAASLTESADLVISCADGSSDFLQPTHDRVLRCATRADIAPRSEADLHTAAISGSGLEDLARAVRDALLRPDSPDLDALWRFHSALPTHPQAPTAPH